jgi:very-short-patch-repair endonuclease
VRRSQLGVPIRRQHPIGPYIVDFYCPAARLVIELDGPHHREVDAQRHHDARRDEVLALRGIHVTRVDNADVLHRRPEVVACIALLVRERSAQRT